MKRFILPKINFPKSRLKLFSVVCLLTLIVTNSIVFSMEIRRIAAFQSLFPYENIGYKFAGIDAFTKDFEYMGYYTDGDIEDRITLKNFSQVQYLVAPTILHFNNIDHEYILFVCYNEKNAWRKIKEMDAIPLKRNNHGVILAKRRRRGFR